MKKVFTVLGIALGLLFITTLNAQQAISKKPDTNFAKGRFIVKFKSDGREALRTCAHCLLSNRQKFQNAFNDHSTSIDNLNQHYKVKNARSLFVKRDKLSTSQAKNKIESQLQKANFKIQPHLLGAVDGPALPDLSNVYVFEVPEESDIEKICQHYQSDPHVEYAQPDYLMTPAFLPNDPRFLDRNLWGLEKIQTEMAWDVNQGQGVFVAVVDTGVNYLHEDLAANIWTNTGETGIDSDDNDKETNGIDDDENGHIDDVHGWDFGNDDNDPMDKHSHGSHVAGTIAAVGNNGIGVIGVAPQATIMPVKGFSDAGTGFTSDLAEGIFYAVKNGAEVINNSWGCKEICPSNPVAEAAVKAAYNSGVVVVFSAGNEAVDVSLKSPQNMSETITVAASDSNDNKASFSNFGGSVIVAAPGRSVLSTTLADKYGFKSGTSMAAPHVTGLAALIAAHQPTFTNDDISQVLRVSADDIDSPGFDFNSGYGRINAEQALNINSVLKAKINYPNSGVQIEISNENSSILIDGAATGDAFQHYQLSYRNLNKLGNWFPIGPVVTTPIDDGSLGAWGLNEVGVGQFLLRLVATDSTAREFEDIVEVKTWIRNPGVQQITTNIFTQEFPVISGQRVAWIDFRNFNANVFLYDFSTGQEKQITTDLKEQVNVSISGDLIVWEDWRNVDADIFLYDITTGVEQQITSNSAVQTKPDISGNKIVWQDLRDSNWDIYLYDVTIGIEKKITNSLVNQLRPAISGDKIVWEDSRNGNSDIYMYAISTGGEKRITQNSLVDWNADISGDWIVWERTLNETSSIILYDITTGVEKTILSNGQKGLRPVVAKNYVVWKDFRNGNGDIYVYNIANDTTQFVTTEPSLQQNPAIDTRRIVWEDFRNGNADIFVYELPNNSPVVNPIENKSVDEGQTLSFIVTATDVDGEPLTYTALSLPDGASFNSATQIFSWTPGFDQSGVYDGVRFEVSDGKDIDFKEITITVNDVVGNPQLFFDDFSTDTTGSYTVTDTWTSGGTGRFVYDGAGQRSQVLTGDNIGLRIGQSIPATDTGTFKVDFEPVKKYPAGGGLMINLRQDADHYYRISNTDGYGPRSVEKVVGRRVVERVFFASEYIQGAKYSIVVNFNPTTMTVRAFGDQVTLSGNGSAINVSAFEITTSQQDAYYDNIEVRSDIQPNNPPVLNTIGNKVVDEGETLSFTVTATDDDGEPLTYAALSLPDGASFNSATQIFSWTPNFDQSGVYDGVRFEVSDGVDMVFEEITITVNDVVGNPQLFFDDFSTDTTGAYTVTDTWTAGGTGRFVYDSTGQRAKVVTGDNIGLKIGQSIPATDTGTFKMDFEPVKKYPAGGGLMISLNQDAGNYYRISNTDGYGPRSVEKVVGRRVVERVFFASEYIQGTKYSIVVNFSPTTMTVRAFGDQVTLSGNGSAINVSAFEITTSQQDAYYDNIEVRSDVQPPPASLFFDDFSTDTIGAYTVTDTWTAGGTGRFVYDSVGQRAKVVTGDNIGLKIGQNISATDTGAFKVDFEPVKKHPLGGIITINLKQDANNYYRIRNTDGYGTKAVEKIVGGRVVESVFFASEFVQGNIYSIVVDFSPTTFIVTAFGDQVTLSRNSSAINVSTFEIEARQQDVYLDNIEVK